MGIKEIIRIIREIAIVVILIVIGYKIISSNFSINVGTLSVTDIVALLLAFFAVGLSSAFYFKGSEASNLFYDNMHKFTQDTSVILGKIESKFSEQLKNIEQRSADLKTSVDKYYATHNSSDTNTKKEQTEKQVNKSKEQYDELIEQVFSKVQIDANEKAKLKSDLQNKEDELRELQKSLSEIELNKSKIIANRTKGYLSRRIQKELDKEDSIKLSPKELFLKILRQSVSAFRSDMKKSNYITTIKPREIEDITDSGFQFFMEVLDSALTESDDE